MITITDRAATELPELLEASAATPEQGVKLSPDGQGGVQVAVGTAEAGDEVVRDDGRSLLIVDPAIGRLIDGAILDSESVEINGRDAVRLRLVR